MASNYVWEASIKRYEQFEFSIISLVIQPYFWHFLGNFDNFLSKSSLDFGIFGKISIISLVCSALIWTASDRKPDRFHEKIAFRRKKWQVLKKISNRFLTFGKNFQNLTFFLLERDLFHEIDQIFIKIFENVAFWRKKCQVLKKFSNRFLAFGKKFQNLTFFFARTRSFSWNRSDFH